MEMIIQAILPLLVSGAVMLLMKLLKAASTYVATRGDLAKRVILTLVSLAATLLSPLVGVELPADLLNIDAGLLTTVVNTALTALVAHLLHKGTNAVTA